MKKSLKSILTFFIVTTTLGACRYKGTPPVPGDWYQFPENGGKVNVGSLEKLGTTVDQLFAAQANVLETFSGQSRPTSITPRGIKPVDWVPWHMSGMTTGFAITGEGILGSLLFEGTAAVQAVWLHSKNPAVTRTEKPKNVNWNFKKKADLVIVGTATTPEIAIQLEPTIRAALASGAVKNEKAFRKNMLFAAENFRAMAWHLSNIDVPESKFKPSALVLEVSVSSEGEVTPGISIGAALEFRFDWVIHQETKPSPNFAGNSLLASNQLGQSLERFVYAITPDLNEAAAEARSIKESGFELTMIRIGLGMSAEREIGVASSSAEVMAHIVFGDNASYGGCYDPDGDGDCHSLTLNGPDTAVIKSLVPSTDEFSLITHNPKAEHLSYANRAMIPFSMRGNEVLYKIPHRKFRAGLRKAVKIGGFFARHANAVKSKNWKIKELEAEFELSLSGDIGLTTVGGVGEIELEFEKEE